MTALRKSEPINRYLIPPPMPKYQISVKVRPEYLPDRSNPEANEFVFAYHVTITNTGQIAAQVIARTWNINHASGLHEKVKGLAVVGHQPLLGQTAAQLLNLAVPECAIRKGAVWWLRRREREEGAEVVLLAVQSPEFL